MNTFSCHELKNTAKGLLAERGSDPRRLVAIYAGVSAGVSLAVLVISFLLNRGIAETGGLSGLGTRSMLSTIAVVLQVVVGLLLPLWTMGYKSAALCFARRGTQPSLLTGFQNFSPVFRLLVLKALILGLAAFLCLYPATILFFMTPLAEPVNDVLAPYVVAQTEVSQIMQDTEAMAALQEAARPLLLFFGGLLLLVAVPVFYRLRFAELALMDNPKSGARAALKKSLLLTKRRCGQLLTLDISYWWYYLLSAGAALFAYGDSILSFLGVSLPISADAAYFLFSLLHLALTFALAYAAQNQVETTYALCYDAFANHASPHNP